MRLQSNRTLRDTNQKRLMSGEAPERALLHLQSSSERMPMTRSGRIGGTSSSVLSEFTRVAGRIRALIVGTDGSRQISPRSLQSSTMLQTQTRSCDM